MGSPPFVGVWRVQTPSVSRRDSDPARACLRVDHYFPAGGRNRTAALRGQYLKPFFPRQNRYLSYKRRHFVLQALAVRLIPRFRRIDGSRARHQVNRLFWYA